MIEKRAIINITFEDTDTLTHKILKVTEERNDSIVTFQHNLYFDTPCVCGSYGVAPCDLYFANYGFGNLEIDKIIIMQEKEKEMTLEDIEKELGYKVKLVTK